MFIKTMLRRGAYHDSVSLMRTAKELNSFDGVADSAVIMATAENKRIVRESGLYGPELDKAGDNDLAVIVKASTAERAAEALLKASTLLEKKADRAGASELKARGLDAAAAMLPGANLALISVAGRFAGKLAADCLDRNMNVMLFSDNVPLETEIELKKIALKKGLLVMGPDCGTAIINGVPLAFANSVNRGPIGIAAASGTGLQEVSVLISNEGSGISQAVGAGSRDIRVEVGALTLIQGLKALASDPKTSLIVLISKPSHPAVMKKILRVVRTIRKPVVSVMLGGEAKLQEKKDFYSARTLEEAALKAVCLARDGNTHKARERIFDINTEVQRRAAAGAETKRKGQRYLRGLFSGGTFVSEAQLVLRDLIGPLWSNAPLDKRYTLSNPLRPRENSAIDLGGDEFTVGRPHPMIDYTLRNRMIESEAKKPETALILLDVVLGYGANPRPLEDLLPAIRAAFKANNTLSVVASVTGTETDPQVRSKVAGALEKAGVLVMPSNASACRLAGEIIRRVNSKA